jgi:hypothetical protein
VETPNEQRAREQSRYDDTDCANAIMAELAGLLEPGQYQGKETCREHDARRGTEQNVPQTHRERPHDVHT